MYDQTDEERLDRMRLMLKLASQIGGRNAHAADAVVACAANILQGVVYRQSRKAKVIPFPHKR